MLRIMELDLSGRRLVLRVIASVTFSALTFALLFSPIFFWVLPSGASAFLLTTRGGLGSKLLSSLISPEAPTLGLFIVMLVFAWVLLRGTKVEGLLTILNGLAFAAYVYALFQGGTIQLEAVGKAFGTSDATLNLSLDATTVMLAFLVPPFLTIARGVALIVRRHSQQAYLER